MLEDFLDRPALSASARDRQRLDLQSRAEIRELVVSFYREVIFDEVLGPMFEQVAQVDWSVHIPKLTDYWCRVPLGEPGYEGRILGPHQRVHALESFRSEMFDRWYGLFVEAVDRGWQGPIAERAKEHAETIGRNLSRRLIGETWTPNRS